MAFIPELINRKTYNEDGVGGMHVYSPWWLDNKKLDFPRGYHIEIYGGLGAPSYGTGFNFNSLNSLLGQRSEFVLKNNFGKRTVKEVVSGERDELMSIMLSSLNDSVVDLGVEIIDFRVKRIDLPSNLSNSVYERMRTERQRLAEELRSEGKEIAREITAEADKEKVVILAEAYKLAEQLRGQGDAEAAGIYAQSFSQDPEFYEFTRSMKAYVETFENKSDVMLIDSDSEFFKYLNDKKDEK